VIPRHYRSPEVSPVYPVPVLMCFFPSDPFIITVDDQKAQGIMSSV